MERSRNILNWICREDIPNKIPFEQRDLKRVSHAGIGGLGAYHVEGTAKANVLT